MALTALALNCTLKPGKQDSSTDKLLKELLRVLGKYDVDGEIVRVADHNIKPGVTSDAGEGDEWPALRKRDIAADILIIGTPIWLGQPSGIAKRVLERMDALLEETDKKSACHRLARSPLSPSSATRTARIIAMRRFTRL